MKIVIGEDTYTQIQSLSFNPEADISGNTIPVNEFSADIITNETIYTRVFAALYDDLDNVWANYWITQVYKIDEQTVRVYAQSVLTLLDRLTLTESYVNGIPFGNVIDAILMGIPVSFDYTVDPALASKPISGYFPEQTLRERMQWACFVVGAYVKSFFTDKLEILPVNNDSTFIPINKTYWKPTVTYNDYVTAVKVKAYTYQDEVLLESQWYTLNNPDVPLTAMPNVVEIDKVTIVNTDNVSDILSNLALYYFNRKEADMDVINNAEYMPGQKIQGYLNENEMLSGYIASCSFTFGLQAKSSIHLVRMENIESGKLIITYKYNNRQIDKKTYNLPVGYAYEFINPYIEMALNKHWYVFRPTTEKVTGTMTSGTSKKTVNNEIALDLYKNVLHIISVDSVNVNGEGAATIA